MSKNTENKGKTKHNKFTNADLKRMQAWDLDTKIATSLTRIAEFYSEYPHKIYILLYSFFSFSQR